MQVEISFPMHLMQTKEMMIWYFFIARYMLLSPSFNAFKPSRQTSFQRWNDFASDIETTSKKGWKRELKQRSANHVETTLACNENIPRG